MKLFLAIASSLIAVTIACSSYRSEGSQSASNGSPGLSQPSAQTSNTGAQDKPTCQLTLAGAPEINGLKLGMTPEQVMALFPGSSEDAEVRASLSLPASKFGTSSFVIKPDKYESKAKFAGISQITVALLDGRASNFRIGYNGPEWPHVDKFIAKFSEGANLPAADQWEAYVGMETQLKSLKCTDFEIRVFAGGTGGNLNYAEVRDLEADKKLKDRRDKARAKPSP